MKAVTPQSKGLDPKFIYDFVSSLDKRGLHMHSVLMMRGEDIIYEGYWKPFNKDFNHRMYSVTKSFVSIAIGLLEEDGLINLDDKIVSYFPDKVTEPLCQSLKEQTIKDMLTMSTCGLYRHWFDEGDPDRTHLYFTDIGKRRPSNTIWEYDSAGSQVLSALVERVSKRSLFDFLNERIFSHIGTFKNAKILKTPNGDSWGDSAMICTLRDLASFARFVMNYGTYNGKRLLNEEYLKVATSKVVSNIEDGFGAIFNHGYGYQIWRTEEDGFAFVGMGDQLAICLPKYDFIFCCNGDNQGNKSSSEYLLTKLFDCVVANLKDVPVLENEEESNKLSNLTKNLELYAAKGQKDSPLREIINKRTYVFEENDLSLQDLYFDFENEKKGKMVYTRNGNKMEIDFLVNENQFSYFPELSYSNEYGGKRTTDGFKYKDAVSLAWLQDNKILLLVQIIDNYFGNTSLIIAFRDDKIVVKASKNAEDFLYGYEGIAIGKAN